LLGLKLKDKLLPELEKRSRK